MPRLNVLPKIPITDKRFVYTSAVHTDLHAVFARIRATLAANRKAELEQQAQEQADTARIHIITATRRVNK